MASRASTKQIRKQRQHRRAGHVKRIEFVLDARSERDHEIYDFMDALPRGAAAEFIRTAIHEKIQREQQRRPPAPQPEPEPVIEPEPADTTASEAFEAIMRELADLRQAVAVGAPSGRLQDSPGHAQRGATVSSGIDARAAPPGRPSESSGIDLSGGPPPAAPGRARAPAPPPTLPEVDQQVDEQDFVARFLGSVSGYRGA